MTEPSVTLNQTFDFPLSIGDFKFPGLSEDEITEMIETVEYFHNGLKDG